MFQPFRYVRLKFLSLGLALALIPTGVWAATYYVATNGSDGNDGSQANPWGTLQYSSTHTSAGDVVMVEDGTYVLPGGGGTGDWAIASSGSSGARITYKAQHKWQAKLVGHGSGDGTVVVGVSGSYNIIQDFDITGTDANGIILATTGNNVHYNQAIGNYLHDMITPCDGNSGTAISNGGGSNYSGVDHNDIIGNFVINFTPYNGCPGGHAASGIYLQTPDSLAANNIIINAGTNIQTWHAAMRETIFGNVSIGGVMGITLGAGDSPGGILNDNSLVQNNICIGNTAVGLQEHGSVGSNNRFIDNVSYNNSRNVELINASNSGLITADPKLVNNNGGVTGDYGLQATSPARGAGAVLPGVTVDYKGARYPGSGTTDIGAILYGASTPPPPPPPPPPPVPPPPVPPPPVPPPPVPPPPVPIAVPVIMGINGLGTTLRQDSAMLQVSCSGGTPQTVEWTFSPRANASANRPTAALSNVSTAAFAVNTPSPFLRLSNVPGLGLGDWHVSVRASNSAGSSNTATGDFTLVISDLSNARVYPNPWRADVQVPSITFDRLSPTSTVKIFSISGHLIKKLDTSSGTVKWNLTNDLGDEAASGVYLYVISNDEGQKTRGKLAIIR